jgi:hypothetical protein
MKAVSYRVLKNEVMLFAKFVSFMFCNSSLLEPHIVSTAERASAGVSCGQFGTVRLKCKLSTYIEETVGDKWEGLHIESFK